ncbi:MAG: HAMP domain-containing sensor histidine kinase [Planctomycetota bacterium]|nr:HAMP domain-containing sensor histidine kinase [Planctomycetota bacterium]
MRVRLSLPAKCLLVFGGAIVLIVAAALWAPWLRMTFLVDAGQRELSRQMIDTWERLGRVPASPEEAFLVAPTVPRAERAGITARDLTLAAAETEAERDAFVREALDAFSRDASLVDYQTARWEGTSREYRYAKVHRVREQGGTRITRIVVLQRRSLEAARLLLLNSGFIVAAGLLVGALAVLVFYVITRKLVLQPVRSLRLAAERVREGNLASRSDIRTGDEFEELSETLNSMLTDLQASQDRLRAINTAMDVKLHELAESNQALYQAAKLKGEFLANVSHELRTPLNSINGFAELLVEQARADAAQADAAPSVLKRIRYLENIQNAGRSLLALINSLLEMARIEAGRVDVRVERVNMRDACEGLVALIQPLADKKGVQVRLEVGEDVPVVTTDPRKFQQIIFNFLSNAVKFTLPEEKTGRPPQITLRAERLVASAPGEESRVRISVIDNGPGIPADERARIFEKFYQRDATHTREHTGTGLGLSISKELAGVLSSEIQVESEVGRGSMFSLIMPVDLQAIPREEAALEAKFKGVLSGVRAWE